ncbi:MAG: type III-A CRISPR-associated RAMP protein Csm3 [Candidatus Brocadiae bacterium]|nr:type III-A CRISPR-associated RAMP protein Csm3 [Candidatus Brocadiia bacterium]
MFYGKLLLSGILTNQSGISIGQDKSHGISLAKKIVRHPITSVPFIPASSFRGAIRRVLEKEAGKDCHHKTQNDSLDCSVCQIFGVSPNDFPYFMTMPGRLIIRDIFLTEESKLFLKDKLRHSDLTELRFHRATDRITAQSSLYALEEIPAGCHFAFDSIFTIYEKKDINHFKAFLQSLVSLESSSIGANSSRGLGRILFGKWNLEESQMDSGLNLVWHSRKYYEKEESEKNIFYAQDKKNIQEILDNIEIIQKTISQGA